MIKRKGEKGKTKNLKTRAGEKVKVKRAYCSAEDLSSSPTYTGWLTTTCDFCAQESDALSWPSWALYILTYATPTSLTPK